MVMPHLLLFYLILQKFKKDINLQLSIWKAEYIKIRII